jgi:hypothetical protein
VYVPHATNCVLDLHFANDLSTERLNLLQELPFGWNALFEGCLEIWLRRGVSSDGWYYSRADYERLSKLIND